jgi:hypothetical protein
LQQGKIHELKPKNYEFTVTGTKMMFKQKIYNFLSQLSTKAGVKLTKWLEANLSQPVYNMLF